MQKIDLKYGINPNQGRAYICHDDKLPITILNGIPGYINLLDGLNAYQLVSELKQATSYPAAASFKHVSPAGAAIGVSLDETEKRMYYVTPKTKLSPLSCAYIRARGADRMSSFGDFIALSDTCDRETASIINKEVSDGVIAPDYTDEALEILKRKRNGSYNIIRIDSAYKPTKDDIRTIFGLTLVQERNSYTPTFDELNNIISENKSLPYEAKLDLIVALISLKYTQSNSVIYAYRGQTIGVGAGGQSRLHCTRLAGDKADKWLLRHHERVLNLPFREKLSRNEKDNIIEQYLSDDREIDIKKEYKDYFTTQIEYLTADEKKEYLKSIHGISLASDAFFPFKDNIYRCVRSGVDYICEPGGSMRDNEIIESVNSLNKVLIFNKHRLFQH